MESHSQSSSFCDTVCLVPLERGAIAVTGVSGDVGLGVVEAIKASNPTAIIVGLDSSDTCFGARLVNHYVRTVPVAHDRYASELSDAIYKYDIQKIIPCIDGELRVLLASTAFEPIAPHLVGCKMPLLGVLGSKYWTSQWIFERGLNAPRSVLVESNSQLGDLVGTIGNATWVLKPDRGGGSRGVQHLKRGESIDAIHPSPDQPWCAQELLVGPEYTASAVFSMEHQLLDLVVLRRWLVGGRTAVAQVCGDAELIRYVWEVAKNLTVASGPINIQFIDDIARGPAVFEINPRFSGSTQIRTAFGFNEFEIMFAEEPSKFDQIVNWHQDRIGTYAYRTTSIVVLQ